MAAMLQDLGFVQPPVLGNHLASAWCPGFTAHTTLPLGVTLRPAWISFSLRPLTSFQLHCLLVWNQPYSTTAKIWYLKGSACSGEGLKTEKELKVEMSKHSGWANMA